MNERMVNDDEWIITERWMIDVWLINEWWMNDGERIHELMILLI